MSECTCIVECSHCVEIARLTRELDEARRLHMGQAGRAAGWRARARYAREALERLIELVADDPEAKDTTTPLCVAVTVARAEVTAIEEAERRDALAGEGEAPTCTWTQDDEGVWHTGCGASWIYFPGGTPDEHGQHFCHACGQRVEAEPHAEGEDEELAPELKGGRDA